MRDDMRDNDKPFRGFRLPRAPLFRLLAINLAAGVAVAVLLVGGLLLLNPGGLRHLIFADRAPGIALGLLLFGFHRHLRLGRDGQRHHGGRAARGR